MVAVWVYNCKGDCDGDCGCKRECNVKGDCDVREENCDVKGVCYLRNHSRQNTVQETHISMLTFCTAFLMIPPKQITNAVCLPALNHIVPQYHVIWCSVFLKSCACTTYCANNIQKQDCFKTLLVIHKTQSTFHLFSFIMTSMTG